MTSAASRMRPRIKIFRKLSILTWSSPLFNTPSTNRPTMVLPMPPRPPNRLVPPDDHSCNRVEQVGVEFVLLRAAEMGDAEHAADAGTDRSNHHDASEDHFDVEPGIFGRLAIATDHVNVAAEAGVGQNHVAAEQHHRGNDYDPGNTAD